MRPIRSVSVLVPTYQGIEFLERLLTALASQELDLPWDVLAVDSSSSDGTWEKLGEWAARFPVPFSRRRIDPVEFDHGDTRNVLAAHSSGDLLVYLTQDAIPTSPKWLATLVRDFDDPAVGAAYCRNMPRADASLVTRILSRDDPGYAPARREVRVPDAAAYAAMNAHERRLLYNFNDVASALRRELWERHPFPRTPFGEDVLMARALLDAGFTIVYDADAAVEHSHDYGPEEMRARAEIDGRFNAEWLDRVCIATRADIDVTGEREVARDREAFQELGLAPRELEAAVARAKELRNAAFTGLFEGGQSRRRRASSRLLDRTAVSVLFVVHGFPPDTWAGTEIYTLNLARALAARGHRVTILARTPAEAGDPRPDFSLAEGEFEGLRVLRIVRRLAGQTIEQSYRDERVDTLFRALLERERPDVVHFQHLIHLSVGMVDVAREFGIPTLITCHDYWSLCSRVQLIRPDGVRCVENMGAGCLLCVRAEHLDSIPDVRELASRRTSAAGGADERSPATDLMHARELAVRAAYQAADLRISPSRFLRRKLIDTAGFDAESFVYSDNGMRTDHVRALRKEPDPAGRVRFGFVGSLVWYKGGEVLLKAMRRLRGARAVLNVYGDFRPDEDAHHGELASLAGDNVRFHGRFDNARLSEVYAEIDVLVVPSVWFENSPITIHEAFLTHTPVLASDIGGMAEYVRDGIDGLWFRAGDDEDLARKLRRFVDEPTLHADLSRSWPELKTITEDARETEFRYRSLICAARPALRNPDTVRAVMMSTGADTATRIGTVEPQGADAVLLHPGAAVEFDIRGIGGGVRRVEVEHWFVGGECDLFVAGRVSIDGREVGRIDPVRSRGVDEHTTYEFEAPVEPSAARLRVEALSVEHGGAGHLRVRRVTVSLHEPASMRANPQLAIAPDALRRPRSYAELGRARPRSSRVYATNRAAGAGGGAAGALLERAAVDTVKREGAVEVQHGTATGGELLLLRPGGAVEYDIHGAGGGWRLIQVEQVAFRNEAEVELAGRVWVDGALAGELSAFVAEDVEQSFTRELLLDVDQDARILRLESSSSDTDGSYLRIARVRAVRAPRTGASVTGGRA